MIVREIGLAKNNLISWQEFQEMYLGDLVMVKVGHIYMDYEESKKKNLQLDLNDLQHPEREPRGQEKISGLVQPYPDRRASGYKPCTNGNPETADFRKKR